MENIRFDGQTAVITGGAGGLGFAYAKLLALRGAFVVINDNAIHNDQLLADTAVDEIKALGGEAMANYADVSSEEEVSKMFEGVENICKKIDVFIHNAGNAIDIPFLEMSKRDWNHMMDVHLNGAYYLLKNVIPIMLKNQYGLVVMVTSSMGMYGREGNSAYGAAKMGVYGLVQSIKRELKGTGVVCGVISPLAVTRQTEMALGEGLRHVLKTDMVAPLVGYLASNEYDGYSDVLVAGGGYFSSAAFYEGEGVVINEKNLTVESVKESFKDIGNMDHVVKMSTTNQAGKKIFRKLLRHKDE
jgi:NAD(P)-dependent dehydrogenase (short-subunit alcohol dehydrogenase family)